ncbi:MAG: ATP-dependent zinc metalloprotease FtsH [Oscillospiraceae bacterium]|jgi:cell division protease FtsH|nr:ATP-dependent zinc metalloprotease FtsH [Oscillospiraceae bacterium]
MKKADPKDILFYLVIIIILVVVVSVLYDANKPEPMKYSEVLRDFRQEQVESFVIEANGQMTMYMKDKTRKSYKLLSIEFFRQDLGAEIEAQTAQGKLTEYDYKPGWEPPWWVMFIPYVLIIVVFIALWFFMMNRTGGGESRAMTFKRANPRLVSDEKKKYTFNDVQGAEEEKEELHEIVEFLKSPKRFVEIGARIPKGVLLVGPPGTGKTLLAKAVAGEAGVQFLSISGSDFVELYVGVGASRVRDLFGEAKKVSPSIIFIDEIDAVGRHRGAGMGGGHDEREQTLNQLLVEMDGFSANEGVIILAATNRVDILDPALLRPGRFDRQVYVGIPDIRGREAILKLHAKNKPLDEGVDLNIVAKTTPGFTGADLENLLNEAALLAARRSKRAIGMSELEEAMIKVIAGPEKRSRVVTEKSRKLTAYHEAGHAVAIRSLEHSDPVHQISIIPRGMAGGMTITLPEEDKDFVSKNEMLDRMVGLLGGRVAEKLVLGDISTGASSDIRKVTSIARSMVTKYGMSDILGPINYGTDNEEVFLGRDYGHTRAFSEESTAQIDREIKSLVDNAYERCESILSAHMDKLRAVADYLLEHETMDSVEFERYFKTGRMPDEGTDGYEVEVPT